MKFLRRQPETLDLGIDADVELPLEESVSLADERLDELNVALREWFPMGSRRVARKLAPIIERMLADERERIAREIAGSVSYGFEMRPDGTEDPLAAAYAEGLHDAHAIARGRLP